MPVLLYDDLAEGRFIDVPGSAPEVAPEVWTAQGLAVVRRRQRRCETLMSQAAFSFLDR
jgi:hypothetical protein